MMTAVGSGGSRLSAPMLAVGVKRTCYKWA